LYRVSKKSGIPQTVSFPPGRSAGIPVFRAKSLELTG
jgi:hypothetical protein